MVKMNWDEIDETADYTPAPAGEYLCEAAEVIETTTSYGDEMWKVKFEIIEGEYSGKPIYDNIIFSDKAAGRAKLILSRLGVDVSGKRDVKSNEVRGKIAYLTVEIGSYEKTLENGEQVKRYKNDVTFAGYRKYDGAVSESKLPPEEKGKIPF